VVHSWALDVRYLETAGRKENQTNVFYTGFSKSPGSYLKMKKKHLALLGAFSVCISASLWGFDGIVLTPRLYNLDVVFVVFILHLIPFSLMNLLLFREYRHLSTFRPMDYALFFLVALSGGAIGTFSIVKALFLVNFQHLTVVILLQKLQPVFALFLAAIILKEKITRTFALWAVLAISMGYFLTFGFHLPNFDTGAKTTYAAMYALLAAFSVGSSTVISKKILQKYNFRTATFYRYGFTAVIMFVVVLATGVWDQFQVATSKNWLIFLVIGLTTGSGAIFLYYFGLKKVKAMVATICELCFPVSAIIFDYLFNGKILSIVQWISAIIMLLAIVRISLSNNQRRTKQAESSV